MKTTQKPELRIVWSAPNLAYIVMFGNAILMTTPRYEEAVEYYCETQNRLGA